MPVAKQGDRYIYFPPTPFPCPFCGVRVVSEYGYLEFDDYDRGLVLHHHCDVQVAPLNERQWMELQAMNTKPLPLPPQPRYTRLPAQRLDEAWLL